MCDSNNQTTQKMCDRGYNGAMIPTKLIREARDWLLDCGAPPRLVRSASDVMIRREVDKQYVGGWSQFMKDGY